MPNHEDNFVPFPSDIHESDWYRSMPIVARLGMMYILWAGWKYGKDTIRGRLISEGRIKEALASGRLDQHHDEILEAIESSGNLSRGPQGTVYITNWHELMPEDGWDG